MPRCCAASRDRIAVKRIAEGAGLRVVPWNGEALDGADAAVDGRRGARLPRDAQGRRRRGRAGIRRVDDEAELLAVIEQAAAEAQASFGDATAVPRGVARRVPATSR